MSKFVHLLRLKASGNYVLKEGFASFGNSLYELVKVYKVPKDFDVASSENVSKIVDFYDTHKLNSSDNTLLVYLPTVKKEYKQL